MWFRFLLRWPVQKPLRALGKLGLEEMVFFLNTTPAGLDCSALLPSLLALGPATVPCSSIIMATVSSLCRLSVCRIHHFTSTRRTRISPRLTSSHLLYHPRLILCHFTIREKKLMTAFQESSQVKIMLSTTYSTIMTNIARILCSCWLILKVQ